MAQSNNDWSALEKQLCSIQDTLYTLRQNYSYTNDDYCDSLQNSFSILLEELCTADKGMKYDFRELRKKERQFTMAVSTDGDMRIFSRNTYFGGSMPLFASYIQYKDKEQSYFFDINEDDDMGICYKRYGTTGRPVVPAQSGYPGTGVIITTCPVVQIQVQEANLPILYVSVQQLYHHFKL